MKIILFNSYEQIKLTFLMADFLVFFVSYPSIESEKISYPNIFFKKISYPSKLDSAPVPVILNDSSLSKFLYQCDGEIISTSKNSLPKAKTKKQRGTQGTVEGELTKVRPVGVQTKVQNLYQLDSHAGDPIKDKVLVGEDLTTRAPRLTSSLPK